MGLSVHVDNEGKDTLIPGERSTQELDDTILTAEAKYSINFTKWKICIKSTHGSNSFLLVNTTKIR